MLADMGVSSPVLPRVPRRRSLSIRVFVTVPLLISVAGCQPRTDTPDPLVTAIVASVDTALIANDPVQSAKTFVDAARTLRELQETRGTFGRLSTNNRDATSIAEQMSRLLHSDARGTVAQLETIDPTGDAVIPWAQQMLAAGEAEDLHAVLGELWRGPDGDPLAHLAERKASVDLGYLIGAVILGLRSTVPSADDSASVLRALLGIRSSDSSRTHAVLSLASERQIDAAVGGVERGVDDTPGAFYTLMVAGLSAETRQVIDTAMTRVIRWHRLDR